MTTFIRLREADVDSKGTQLRQAVASKRAGSPNAHLFELDEQVLSEVPGSPFAYWIPDVLRARFGLVAATTHVARVGIATGNDARFLRAWWEPKESTGQRSWKSFAKGGAYARYYQNFPLVIDWRRAGEPIELSFIGARAKKPEYGWPGLTWTPRSQRGLGFRVMPRGGIFGIKGPAVFLNDGCSDGLFALLGCLSSKPFVALVELQTSAASYEAGIVGGTPLPDVPADDWRALELLTRRAWSLKRLLDTNNETSHAFLLPSVLNERVTGYDRSAIECEVDAIEAKIDDIAFALYCIGSDDRAAIESSSKRPASEEDASEYEDDRDANEDSGEEELSVGAVALPSWLVGVSFGRFDPRLATGPRLLPPEPEPFDALPSRSGGMYPEGDEPCERPDILVDDEGHADDLAARVGAVADRVRVDAPENFRSWLAKDFFPLHIRMYSKSRRKAPIYWQLATTSASYSVWLYIHAFNKDTLFRVQNDYAAPKLAHEERRMESLANELRDNETSGQRQALAAQESLVEELRSFLEEVKRVAPLWNPNLDDGVVINFAPLWRLVPQNKSWQKELKSTWDALCEEKYDWAHLAMHLWPERVVPKCTRDRSVAIAHGLEDVFWVTGSDGKWTARTTFTRSVDELVRERSSPAVKSALKSLLDAPGAGGKSNVRKSSGRREEVGAVASYPNFAAVTAGAWARPHTMERGEIQAAVLAVLKANGAPMDRRQARLAALLSLEPHLLAPQLDKTDKKIWLHTVGADAKKAATATIDNTIREWGQALSGLRGRGRLDENLQQNTWALGTGVDAIDTNGWPEGRAAFVVNVLRRLQSSASVDQLITKLPTAAQQWFANAA